MMGRVLSRCAMNLVDLLHQADLPVLRTGPLLQSRVAPEIRGMTTDSRQIQPGDLFIGLPGEHVDGGQFGLQALQAGAAAVLISTETALNPDWDPYQEQILRLPTPELSRATAQLAATFWAHPASALTLVGVTGTNGKTTTTHLIEHLLKSQGDPVGLLGTLYSRWTDSDGLLHQKTAAHTTPFAVDLQRTLATMRDQGCGQVVMEVSSHALAQDRVWGCPFAVAAWTNLTQDHLDYHPTLEDYWQAKARLFSPDYLTGRAILNGDDRGAQRVLQQLQALGHQPEAWVYALDDRQGSQIWPRSVTWGGGGTDVELQTPTGILTLHSPLVGSFNLSNLMAAVGVVLHLGVAPESIAGSLATFGGVPGRMETVRLTDEQDIAVVVDYAHTPDGLENLLRAVRPFAQAQVICVFGCGGDRDRTKRPQMGRIAAEWADRVIVTADNPRTEDPEQILTEIVAGIDVGRVDLEVDGDRHRAIHSAILAAQPGDTVVIAGKGHEDYQILGTTKVHFDDREEARAALALRLGS
ncbi:MAG: UDP-N-acetylmuramoyl-L-alanyl-D-glutamate--2,6-diaminopimelate ligase [Cyanophyceae cyanobacterium]